MDDFITNIFVKEMNINLEIYELDVQFNYKDVCQRNLYKLRKIMSQMYSLNTKMFVKNVYKLRKIMSQMYSLITKMFAKKMYRYINLEK